MTMENEQSLSNQKQSWSHTPFRQEYNLPWSDNGNALFDPSDLNAAYAINDTMALPNLEEMAALVKKFKPKMKSRGRCLITHPDNETYLQRLVDELHSAKNIHTIHPYKIMYSEYMEKDRWTGEWTRDQTVLLDTRFQTWIDDLEDPAEWAIYFGLVKKVMEAVFYEFDADMNVKFNDFRMNLGAARITESFNSKLDNLLFGGNKLATCLY